MMLVKKDIRERNTEAYKYNEHRFLLMNITAVEFVLHVT